MKPILIDLFCGAGGCTKGYQKAGFYVIGVDYKPQPHYCGDEFYQSDALEWIRCYRGRYAAIHASPPCQHYTALRSLHKDIEYPDLLQPTVDILARLPGPFVVENVPGSPISANLMLCGTMFGLRTPCGAELRRHRYFAAPWWAMVPGCAHGGSRWCTVADHTAEFNPTTRARQRVISIVGDTPRDMVDERRKFSKRVISVHGDHARDRKFRTYEKPRVISVTGATPQQNTVHNEIRETFPVAYARIAMGIDWMTMKELSQAIPPAYTEFIGRELIDFLEIAA